MPGRVSGFPISVFYIYLCTYPKQKIRHDNLIFLCSGLKDLSSLPVFG